MRCARRSPRFATSGPAIRRNAAADPLSTDWRSPCSNAGVSTAGERTRRRVSNGQRALWRVRRTQTLLTRTDATVRNLDVQLTPKRTALLSFAVTGNGLKDITLAWGSTRGRFGPLSVALRAPALTSSGPSVKLGEDGAANVAWTQVEAVFTQRWAVHGPLGPQLPALVG